LAFVDPSRSAGFSDFVELVSARSLPETSLADFRSKGYLGVTLFAALVRSSYGPDEPGFFPTQSELGFYFDPTLLLTGQARWGEDYLEECQDFFFEELTPAELLGLSLSSLPNPVGEQHSRFQSELLGVAFLIGEQGRSLLPLTQFLDRLLGSRAGARELEAFVKSVSEWKRETVNAAWEKLSTADRSIIRQEVLGPVSGQAADVLLACGRELLEWRARA